MKRSRALSFAVALGLAVSLGAVTSGCNNDAFHPPPAEADGGEAPGLTPEQAGRVLAKVGDRTITLGDYAKALDRMDQFDRRRYQSKERRKDLLDAMIDVDLLAEEARRRGLDRDPEVQDAIRQILRDAMLNEARKNVPPPAVIPDADVKAFYDKNQDKFQEPERRRVAAIVMKDRKEAEKILKDAQKAKDGKAWGDLWLKHSETAPKKMTQPLDLAGDLGIVGPLDDAKGANAKVPDAVRAEVFKIANIGDVAPELVEVDGHFFIVRLQGKSPPHHRSLQEADRTIRVMIIQEKTRQAEDALEAELRKKFKVEVDDKALADVKVPAGLEKPETAEEIQAEEREMFEGKAPDAGAPPTPSDGPKHGEP